MEDDIISLDPTTASISAFRFERGKWLPLAWIVGDEPVLIVQLNFLESAKDVRNYADFTGDAIDVIELITCAAGLHFRELEGEHDFHQNHSFPFAYELFSEPQ